MHNLPVKVKNMKRLSYDKPDFTSAEGGHMEYSRAMEILYSPDTYEVFYQGKSVWIDNLNNEGEVALIIPENPDERLIVPVADLEEGEIVEKF